MESKKSIREQSDELWEQSASLENEGPKVFLEAVLEHQKESSKIYTNAYYTILILAAIYWILISGNVQEFSFLSIKVGDISILRWIIPVIMSFLFYQGTCAFILESYLIDVSDSYLRKHMPSDHFRTLKYLSYSPSFFNIERFLASGLTKGKWITYIFIGLLVISILLLPFLLIAFFMYANFQNIGGISNADFIRIGSREANLT